MNYDIENILGASVFFGNGIRVWNNEKMVYLNDRYTLCYPPYHQTFVSVYNPKALKVANEIFMICVEKDDNQPNKGIYEGDIIKFYYNGEEKEGIVIYNQAHSCWAVWYDKKEIPYYKAKAKRVIGNVLENQ